MKDFPQVPEQERQLYLTPEFQAQGRRISTPSQCIIIVSGSAKAEMKGMAPKLLKQGDFILLPAKQIHQFTALTPVEIYDVSDAPFDIHYVDAAGKEISYRLALVPK